MTHLKKKIKKYILITTIKNDMCIILPKKYLERSINLTTLFPYIVIVQAFDTFSISVTSDACVLVCNSLFSHIFYESHTLHIHYYARVGGEWH